MQPDHAEEACAGAEADCRARSRLRAGTRKPGRGAGLLAAGPRSPGAPAGRAHRGAGAKCSGCARPRSTRSCGSRPPPGSPRGQGSAARRAGAHWPRARRSARGRGAACGRRKSASSPRSTGRANRPGTGSGHGQEQQRIQRGRRRPDLEAGRRASARGTRPPSSWSASFSISSPPRRSRWRGPVARRCAAAATATISLGAAQRRKKISRRHARPAHPRVGRQRQHDPASHSQAGDRERQGVGATCFIQPDQS